MLKIIRDNRILLRNSNVYDQDKYSLSISLNILERDIEDLTNVRLDMWKLHFDKAVKNKKKQDEKNNKSS